MDVTPFCTHHEIPIPNTSIVFDPKVRGYYCKMKYPGYPEGCPNFNNKPRCPPKSKPRPGFSKNGELHLAWVEFDIDAYTKAFASLDEKHATMTQGQLRNSRLWQSSIKKQLRLCIQEHWMSFQIIDALGCGGGLVIGNGINKRMFQSAESAGINMFETAANNGIVIEREYPLHIIRLLAIVKLKAEEKTLEDFFEG